MKDILKMFKTDEFIEYFIVYMIPSSTPLYILIREYLQFGLISSYILANLIGVVGCYYLYKQGIFEKIKNCVMNMRKKNVV